MTQPVTKLHPTVTQEARNMLFALAERDGQTMSAQMELIIRQTFRRLPKTEQRDLLARIERENTPEST